MDKVIIINGCGESGKDTFIRLLSETKELGVANYSSIDFYRTIAKLLGSNNNKTDKNRKFLSDLKKLSISYNNKPFNDASNEIQSFIGQKKEFKNNLLFMHIREPEEIEKIISAFPEAITLLIQNVNQTHTFNNDSDDNVAFERYDYIVDNSSDIQELKENAIIWIEDIFEKNQ